MALDPSLVRAEAAMRHGFACAADGDGEAMVASFRELSDEEVVTAVNLARHVIAEALKDLKPAQEGPLTDDDLMGIGEDIAEEESWAKLDAQTVGNYLREIVRGNEPTTDGPDTASLAIVCGGYLVLAAAPDANQWSAYLDKLLDRIVPGD